jgi:hypothetical protein
MLYKTITLELLQQRPEMYDQLLKNRTLLPTLNHYASQLRDRHQAWKSLLATANPDLDPIQVASQAGEMALQELEDSLPSGSPPDDSEPISLDAAMTYISAHSPPA